MEPSGRAGSGAVRAARSHRHQPIALVRMVRDYGIFDRRESPQYYPAIATILPLGRTDHF